MKMFLSILAVVMMICTYAEAQCPPGGCPVQSASYHSSHSVQRSVARPQKVKRKVFSGYHSHRMKTVKKTRSSRGSNGG